MKNSIDGIKIHLGVRKLELSKRIVNDGLFDEDSDVDLADKQQKSFFNKFVEDVTGFESKVHESTMEYYDASTSSIVSYIKGSSSGIVEPISVFSPMESFGTLRTALVKCNFTDITRLITDLKKKLREEKDVDLESSKMEEFCEEEEDNDDEKTIEEILITEGDPIHTVIDAISNSTAHLCVLMIQQFESLQPQFLDSLISIIYSRESIRVKIAKLRLVVCISTSHSYFNSACSIETLHVLQIERFQFTELNEIFEKIITTDISPAIFSGSFLNYLRTRFFECDYSVTALVKAVQFAFLQKYIEDPLWRIECEDHRREICRYNSLLSIFHRNMLGGETDVVRLHIDIQTKAAFWSDIEDLQVFRERKQLIFERSSVKELMRFQNEILEKMEDFDSERCDVLRRLIREYEDAVENEKNGITVEQASNSTPSKTPLKKATYFEFRQQQNVAMAKSLENPVRTAKNNIFAHIMKWFKSVLKTYPDSWNNVIGKENVISKLVKVSLDANDEFEIEKCLLNDARYEKEAVAVAWRTLLNSRNFKSVPLAEWASDFHKYYKRQNRTEAFFGAAGQLEHMGLIRGAADKKSTNVQVLYHPISFLPNL